MALRAQISGLNQDVRRAIMALEAQQESIVAGGINFKGSIKYVGPPLVPPLPPPDPNDTYQDSNRDIWVWSGTEWVNLGPITGPKGDQGDVGPPGPVGPEGPPGDLGDLTLDELSDVDVHLSATGMYLTKQVDGTWKGQNFSKPLNALSDVTAPANTGPNSLLGTLGPGMTAGVAEWEPVHMDYLQQQVLGPIPTQVHDLDVRVSAIEGSGEQAPADEILYVDLYSGSFTRIQAGSITTNPRRVSFAMATTPGPGGEVITIDQISGSGNAWADFSGTLGRTELPDGSVIHGDTLKQWIRRDAIVTVRRVNKPSGPPVLEIVSVEQPTSAGSSLLLGDLGNVSAPANTPVGKVLGTDSEGHWAPVDGGVGPAGPPGPQGPVGPQGPAGDTSSTGSAVWAWSAADFLIPPLSGQIKVTGTGNQPRSVAISSVDADGVPRNLSLIQPGDVLTVTDDPTTPPITGFARYTVTSDLVLQPAGLGPAYYTFTAVRGDTQGSQTPPVDGTRLRIVATFSNPSFELYGFTFTGDNVPVTSRTGDTWYNTTSGESFVWFDSRWVMFAPGSGGGGGGSNIRVTVETRPPSASEGRDGDVWFVVP